MNAQRKKKLIWVLASLFGLFLVVMLGLYALKEQTDYYFNPSQIAAGKAPQNKRIRAGGVVKKGSVVRNFNNPNIVSFDITDYNQTVSVTFSGILPDLFKEGSGVVAVGKLQQNTFVATQVLAKHDENYMPPKVKKSLQPQNNQLP